jgi:purine-binding chemotaxis protein CheW
MAVATQGAMLVTRVGGLTCAFPIEHVIETMRPLPVEPIGRSGDEGPAVVDGLTMIRGAPVPVVDARRLLGVSGEHAARFVVVRATEHRRVAVVVDAVIAVMRIELATLAGLPPLLGGAHCDSIAAIGARDAGLLVVLDSARLLPADSWVAVERACERGGES